MARSTYRVFLEIDNDLKEVVSAYSELLGVEGIWEQEDGLYLYSNNKDQLEEIQAALNLQFPGKLRFRTLEEEAYQNWNAIWESNYQPVFIAGVCTVLAPFHEEPEEVECIIRISPEMAFGTGHHETTTMMIQQMVEIDFNGKKVLDVGTGTGVLAFYAEKRGADHVFGIDYDEKAVENSRHNQKLNDCKNTIFDEATLEEIDVQTYDVILANINFNVIKGISELLPQFTHKDSMLVTSGYLDSDVKKIEALFSGEFEVVKLLAKKDWRCHAFKRK